MFCRIIVATLFLLAFVQAGIGDVVLTPERGAICGLMEGVDRSGCAISSYRIGTIMIHKTPLNIYAYWRSAKKVHSPILGKNWSIPFFESRIVQVSASQFDCDLPDGYKMSFFRVPRSPHRLTTRYDYCGVVKGRTIHIFAGTNLNVKADLVFRNGRLMQMRYNAAILEFRYGVYGLDRVLCNGRAVCHIDYKKNRSRDFSRIIFADGEESQFLLHTMNSYTGDTLTNAVFASMGTLSKLRLPNSQLMNFTYGFDKHGNGIFRDGDRQITWDSKNGRILSYGDWTYNIKDQELKGGNLHYYRKHANSSIIEEFYSNLKSGMKIRDVNGVRKVSRLFTSGRLRGKPRWVELIKRGRLIRRIEYFYNEIGRLTYFRRTEKETGLEIESWFDSCGRIIKSRSNKENASPCEYVYATDGKLAATVKSGEVIGCHIPCAKEIIGESKDKNQIKKKCDTMQKFPGQKRLMTDLPILNLKTMKLY